MESQSAESTPPLRDQRTRRSSRVAVRGAKPPEVKLLPAAPLIPLPGQLPLPLPEETLPPTVPFTIAPQEESQTSPTQTTTPDPLPTETAPISSTAPSSPKPSPESSPDLTWAKYNEWRSSKCRPATARLPLEPGFDELDNALHEAHGEWAEMADHVAEQSFSVLVDQESRNKLVDEIGDAYFTCVWVCSSLLGDLPDRSVGDYFSGMQIIESHRAKMATLAQCTDVFSRRSQATPIQRTAMEDWERAVSELLLHGFVGLGTISNFWKKVRWQQMEPSPDLAALSARGTLVLLESLCVLVGLTPLFCVQQNINKLDRRFPDGWVPGGGLRN